MWSSSPEIIGEGLRECIPLPLPVPGGWGDAVWGGGGDVSWAPPPSLPGGQSLIRGGVTRGRGPALATPGPRPRPCSQQAVAAARASAGVTAVAADHGTEDRDRGRGQRPPARHPGTQAAGRQLSLHSQVRVSHGSLGHIAASPQAF